jgi:hypothetical protein
MGAVLGLASGKGKLHIASAMGPYPLRLLGMPGRSPEGPISRLLKKQGINLFGFKREERGYRCHITIGFASEVQRTSVSILLSQRRHPGINRGQPISVTYVWDNPPNACFTCYHPDNELGYSLSHPKGKGNRGAQCPNRTEVCSLCHSNTYQIQGCGLEFKHQRIAPQDHFTVKQSSLSEGALASLGEASSRTGTESVASSSLSTSQVRKFLRSSEECPFVSHLYFILNSQQKTSPTNQSASNVDINIRGVHVLCILMATLTSTALICANTTQPV